MSLINDMLKDLDARRGQSTGNPSISLPAGDAGMDDRMRFALLAGSGSIVTAGLLALLLVTDVPASIESRLRSAPTGEILPVDDKLNTAIESAPAGADRVRDPVPEQATTAETHTEQVTTTTAETYTEQATTTTAETYTEQATTTAARQAAAPSTITVRTQTPEERAEQLFRQAARVVSAGRTRQAMRKLEQVLETSNTHREARLMLARLQSNSGRSGEAITLLQQGRELDPDFTDYTRLQATLLMSQGLYEQASQAILESLPATGGDAELHALLAGLHRRSGRTEQAIHHYRIAVEQTPSNGAWWMGLGLSQEQSGQVDAAQQAYRQALKNPLNDKLREFIRQRLDGLRDAASNASYHMETREQG